MYFSTLFRFSQKRKDKYSIQRRIEVEGSRKKICEGQTELKTPPDTAFLSEANVFLKVNCSKVEQQQQKNKKNESMQT